MWVAGLVILKYDLIKDLSSLYVRRKISETNVIAPKMLLQLGSFNSISVPDDHQDQV